ncbi:deleted in malignant brain tumors 1 protein-like [Montipora foliosa]|uniref:deleted in malignant brain tumors 1 protein-like n=1 Tax=Montipora foliosa TaxID=591990 RepID=UPI0035F1E564
MHVGQYWWILLLNVISSSQSVDPDEKLRLVGGTWRGEGRVEIYHNGAWGTVCDDYWDMRDAQVVCRELGFLFTFSAPIKASFGRGSGRIWLDNVKCTGSESSIRNCPHPGWGTHNCGHHKDASVVCSLTSTATTTTVSNGMLRLVGGTRRGEGRVELYRYGAWGTVCDDDWDVRDAQVVCRELGFPFAISAPANASFGRGSGRIWMNNVKCRGHESTIASCSKSGISNCGHHKDASVVCSGTAPVTTTASNGMLRLVGGTQKGEGRVEIKYGSWGTICHDYWDVRDAQVVCRELGFLAPVPNLVPSHFGPGNISIMLDDVRCTGSEASIKNCWHRGRGNHNCGHHKDVSVMCSLTSTITTISSDGKLRLVGGTRRGEGRVEIYHSRSWGTVCGDEWDIKDAQVVCRELGFLFTYAAPVNAGFVRRTGPIWLKNVRCTGTQSSIRSCSHSGLRNHYCAHHKDASVVCSLQSIPSTVSTSITTTASNGKLRLVGGTRRGEGRVEIYHNGAWGTVCDDHWDLRDAQVVCRELGFLSALSAPIVARFGEGSGSIWLDDVQCTGSESSIRNCRHIGWGNENCGHGEDASVVCSITSTVTTTAPNGTLRLAGGTRRGEGRVEIYHNGAWGTVCHDNWDKRDAQVVCRELGFLFAISAPISARFGLGSGSIWLDNVNCKGSESSIRNCPHAGWDNHNCGHYQDASVVCSVANDVKRSEECKAHIQELQFTIDKQARDFDHAKDQWQMERVKEVQLQEKLKKLRSILKGSIRLANGGASSGRVEVFYNGTWGTVCDHSWGISDANVVCRQLGFSRASSAPHNARYGPGTGKIWMYHVNCGGREPSLFECKHDGWGTRPGHCSHSDDASVVCV